MKESIELREVRILVNALAVTSPEAIDKIRITWRDIRLIATKAEKQCQAELQADSEYCKAHDC